MKVYITIYLWLVVWSIFLTFPYIGSNHPNWLIFFRGVGVPPTRYSYIYIYPLITGTALPSFQVVMFWILNGEASRELRLEIGGDVPGDPQEMSGKPIWLVVFQRFGWFSRDEKNPSHWLIFFRVKPPAMDAMGSPSPRPHGMPPFEKWVNSLQCLRRDGKAGNAFSIIYMETPLIGNICLPWLYCIYIYPLVI